MDFVLLFLGSERWFRCSNYIVNSAGLVKLVKIDVFSKQSVTEVVFSRLKQNKTKQKQTKKQILFSPHQ